MTVEITLENGDVLAYDLTDPNNDLIRPDLPKSNTRKWTKRQMKEYARQIAVMGAYIRVGDRVRFISPECICCVEVPEVLDLN